MTHTFIFHTDPGHGWLEVPKEIVKSVGIKVSSYSYENGRYAYLEEDSDAPRFIAACRDAGYTVEYVEKNTDTESKIRGYRPYGGES